MTDELTRILRDSRGSLERYMLLLVEAITEDARVAGREELFTPEAPAARGGRSPRRRPFLREMFHGASELHSALQQLDAIVLYALSFPYRNKKITKAGHLRYHYEAYIQEVALVRARLLAYLAVIERLFRRDGQFPEIRRVTAAIRGSAEETFRDFVSIRHGHVHEARFADRQLVQLSALESIVATGHNYATAYKNEYRAVKRGKVEWMGAWNRSIRDHLDMYCGLLVPLITDGTGHLRWPPGAIRG